MKVIEENRHGLGFIHRGAMRLTEIATPTPSRFGLECVQVRISDCTTRLTASDGRRLVTVTYYDPRTVGEAEGLVGASWLRATLKHYMPHGFDLALGLHASEGMERVRLLCFEKHGVKAEPWLAETSVTAASYPSWEKHVLIDEDSLQGAPAELAAEVDSHYLVDTIRLMHASVGSKPGPGKARLFHDPEGQYVQILVEHDGREARGAVLAKRLKSSAA